MGRHCGRQPVSGRSDGPAFQRRSGEAADFPKLGRIGKITGTRELIPHESYRLVYQVEGENLWVLALVHTARRWPPTKE
ncbi:MULTISPECIES: type II toxin-antitoxin system RelE/ParE family toxin [unclassified Mesorhizobium]|uniref:type II toxin-antitoxin system RelE/ParE family toxin n=1 Tax=unclassified Mesorhizobium TaxID=325217 RepID=UPI001FEE82D4|nr:MULTISPECIES: type II toxin-antitoxin system RelE/ParE family toxin [unclassified Mesorhizobium]